MPAPWGDLSPYLQLKLRGLGVSACTTTHRGRTAGVPSTPKSVTERQSDPARNRNCLSAKLC
ncbi:hypothetical protein FIBSPDRAFT_386159 [Athelia psychrophila]|uniref:Uncharacterized protein n=1 Tax=Athelia psychrophila TaxID=1759441 RepID=A0A167V662_9AGAM|nr:hypothetical protein FIBSPDRAFT_404939 [Fibularhizoctonia sp. CBS 109695]KZP04675.1 hypothetical protein FIBSPDRAFT_386159 [Fibularhizoctonia sp. CBS 109695]